MAGAGGARVALLLVGLVGVVCGASLKGALRAALRDDLPACEVCAPPAGAKACSDDSNIQQAMIWLDGEPEGPGAEYCFCSSLNLSGGAHKCDGVEYNKPIPACPAECQPTAAQTAARNPRPDFFSTGFFSTGMRHGGMDDFVSEHTSSSSSSTSTTSTTTS